MLKGSDFEFELLAAEENTSEDLQGEVKENGSIQTVSNDRDGNIDFSPITISEPGSHIWLVREMKPSEPDPDIEYSDKTYLVVAYFVDNGQGQLVLPDSPYYSAIYEVEKEEDGSYGIVYDSKTEQPIKATEMTFTNSVRTGSVSLTKTVEGYDAADKEFVFDVALKDSAGKALDGEYAWTSSRKDSEGSAITGTVKNGETLSLQKDEVVTISGLPAGSKYEFNEEDVAGYTQSKSSNMKGTIKADDTVKASVTNTYAATGTAQIKAKKVVLRSGQETAPDADAFMFTLNARSDENSDSYDEGVATARHNYWVI